MSAIDPKRHGNETALFPCLVEEHQQSNGRRMVLPFYRAV
jgi:hypothetical protein